MPQKEEKKGLAYFLANDPAWKYISLLVVILGIVIGFFLLFALFIWVMGYVGQGIDIASYNIERKTGVNIWNYITPIFIYGLLSTLYYFVYTYLRKYRHFTVCKFSLGLLALGTLVLLYNMFLTVKIVTQTGASKYVLHMIGDGRALFNIDNPIGVIAVHLLVFVLPGLVLSAFKIPENNMD